MMATRQPPVVGFDLPDTRPVHEAIDFARDRCEPYLFNHVMRSWLFAVRLAELKGIAYDPEVLAVSALLHDITLNDRFEGPRRFEVEAAEEAKAFALREGFDARRAQLVWDGVALNSTPSIGLHKEAEVSLCTAGVCLDVVGLQFDLLPGEEVARILAEYPRLGMKVRMARCFCHIAATHPETTYDNFLRDFGERFVRGYEAPSSADLVADAPFAE
jgi:hypothetical protein